MPLPSNLSFLKKSKCEALASTKESMFKLKSAIAEYFRWLRSNGEDVAIPTRPKLAVVRVV